MSDEITLEGFSNCMENIHDRNPARYVLDVPKTWPMCMNCKHYTKLIEYRLGLCEMSRRPGGIVALEPEMGCKKWEREE
jgi:hypothetical protein